MSKNWYPVIDYEKCAGCMVCNDMCRHGVYKPTGPEGKPEVVYGNGVSKGVTAVNASAPRGPSPILG